MSSSVNPKSDGARKGEARRKLIGEMLIEAGLISQRQLDEALRKQATKGGRTVDALMYLGHLDARKFVEFLARQPGIPSISLKHCQIAEEVLKLVPKEFAIQNDLFPIDKMGRLLTVAMVCPLDTETIRKLEEMTGLKVKPMLCTQREIMEAVARYYEGNLMAYQDAYSIRFQ